MDTFGQVIVKARKAAGLTQKAVAERLRRGDGRRVLPPFLNDLEHDRRYPPEDAMIEQLAKILNLSSDVLYFYAKRVPADLRRDAEDSEVEAAYGAFRKVIDEAKMEAYRSKSRRSAWSKIRLAVLADRN
jgi:transcriptional regulator with XRE-family HTH domain